MSGEGTFARLARLQREKAERVRESAAPPEEAPPQSSGAPPADRPLSIAPPPSSAPTPEAAPPRRAPARRSAPPQEPSAGRHRVAPPLSSAPPQGEPAEIVSEYFKVPHSLTAVLGTLGHAAQLVYIQLIALSYGWKRTVCKVSYPRLGERTNLSVNGVKKAILELERRGFVTKVGEDSTSPIATERGFLYDVRLPEGTPLRRGAAVTSSAPPLSSGPPVSSHMKETKETRKEAPAADASAPSIYEIRTIGARLFERHRSDPGFDHERLAELVADALAAQGITPSGELIEEAIKGMAV